MFYIFKDDGKTVSVLLPDRNRKFVYVYIHTSLATRVVVSALVVTTCLSASLEWRF